MGRTVNKSRPAAVLLPGGEQWQDWHLTAEGNGTAVPGFSGLESPDLWAPPSGHRRLVGLPANSMTCRSIWESLGEESNGPSDEFVQTQIELLQASHSSAGSWVHSAQIINQNAEWALHRLVLLRSEDADKIRIDGAAQYDPAIDFFPWPESGLVVWEELEKIFVACVVKGRPATVQALSAGPNAGRRAVELQLLAIMWRETGLLSEECRLFVRCRSEATREWADALVAEWGPGGECQLHPAAILPGKTDTLPPQSVVRARKATARRRLLGTIGITVGAIFLGVMLIAILKLSLLDGEVRGLRESVQARQPEIASTIAIASDWQASRLATEPMFFALNTLSAVARSLPPIGVRLTFFQQEGATIRLEGDAATPTLAGEIPTLLAREELLKPYTWKSAAPKILPDNTVRFAVEGTVGEAVLP